MLTFHYPKYKYIFNFTNHLQTCFQQNTAFISVFVSILNTRKECKVNKSNTCSENYLNSIVWIAIRERVNSQNQETESKWFTKWHLYVLKVYNRSRSPSDHLDRSPRAKHILHIVSDRQSLSDDWTDLPRFCTHAGDTATRRNTWFVVVRGGVYSNAKRQLVGHLVEEKNWLIYKRARTEQTGPDGRR